MTFACFGCEQCPCYCQLCMLLSCDPAFLRAFLLGLTRSVPVVRRHLYGNSAPYLPPSVHLTTYISHVNVICPNNLSPLAQPPNLIGILPAMYLSFDIVTDAYLPSLTARLHTSFVQRCVRVVHVRRVRAVLRAVPVRRRGARVHE